MEATWAIILGSLVGGVALSLFLFRDRRSVHDDAVVVITGGSAGIGLAYAQSIVSKHRPKKVVLLARNQDTLEKAKKVVMESRSSPTTKVEIVACDVSDDQQAESVSRLLSDVTVFVNCAGLSYPTELEALSVSQIQTMVNTNLLGSIYLTRRLIPYMKSSTHSTKGIVFVSSQAGQAGLYGYTAYSATKFALRGLAEALQMELKPFGVFVSVAYPPDTKTEAFDRENEMKPEATRLMSSNEPMEALEVGSILCSGIERRNFSIWFNFDGFMLTQLTSGFCPPNSVWHLAYQVVCMGFFRLVAAGYLEYFASIVRKNKTVI